MTDKYKNALDAIEVMIDSNEVVYLDIAGEHENTIRDALTLATESEQLHEKLADERMENIKQFALIEQLRKERDELAVKLDKAKSILGQISRMATLADHTSNTMTLVAAHQLAMMILEEIE